MYTQYDFILLESKSDLELRKELVIANQKYDYIQSLYEKEEEPTREKPLLNLNVIFMHLKNVERYIRMIENLLHNYDQNYYVTKVIKRRRGRLSRL